MHNLTKSVVRNLPICFIILIFFVVYTIYVEFVCIPLFKGEGLRSSLRYTREALWNLVCFHLLALLLLWSFVMTCVTPPGFITDEWKVNPNSVYECNERKKNGEFRYCKFEKCYKPDRAHYCRPLGRNVLKMDHYCPWVSNGIGFYNYKYFFLTLLYADLINLFMFSRIYKAFFTSYYDPNSRFNHLFYLSLIGTLVVIISLIIVPFTLFHVVLIFVNKTTIEYCEWKGGSGTDYNLGIVHNFYSVFGGNALLWFFPIGKPPGDGFHFQNRHIEDV
nr:DHHC-containing protein 20 [Theileria orientalis]